MKKSVTAAIVVVTIAVAAMSAFAVADLNPYIQSKPDQIQVTNYSAAINSLKPQITAINNNVSSLSSLKGDISDIRGKLVDLESKINQAEQTSSQSSKPIIVLDKSIYLQGDTILVNAVGLDPQKSAQIQLVDSKGSVVTQVDTISDSAGRLRYTLSLPATIAAGNYQVNITSGQLATWQQIMIVAQSSSSLVTLSGPYLFNVQTDQTVYLPNDVIEVYGTGKPYTSVTGILSSPSGMKLTSNTTVQSDGTFIMFFADSQPFEKGLWNVSVNNQGTNKLLSVSVVGTSNSNLPAFTAQSDFAIYQAGDQIQLSGIAQPYTTVSASLTSPSGKLYITSTTASFDGTYHILFSTSSSYEIGYWNISVTNQGQTRGFSVYVTSTSTNPSSFTAQTDKTIYVKGQQIQISGTGKSYTAVKAELRSPSGTTYNGAVSTNSDGSYTMSFPTSPAFETGNWYITITNWGTTKVISIFLEP